MLVAGRTSGARTRHQQLCAKGAAEQAQLTKLHTRAPDRSTAPPPVMIVTQTDTGASSHKTCPHALALEWCGRQHTAAQASWQP